MRLLLATLFFTVLVAGVWAVSLLMEPKEASDVTPQPTAISSPTGDGAS